VVDFDSVASVSDDFWYEHECSLVLRQVQGLSPTEWGEFQRECLLLPDKSQERIAYVLGDVDTTASARLLLQLCECRHRDTVLTAREAARSLSFDSVIGAALDLWPSVTGSNTNEVLDWIESSAAGPSHR